MKCPEKGEGGWIKALGLGAGVVVALFAPRLSGQNGGPVVQLPPIFVEARSGSITPWLYAEVPGFEVLSACSESGSVRFVEQLRRRRLELADLVPERFLFQSSMPMQLILIPRSMEESLAQEMTQEMAHAGKNANGGAYASPVGYVPATHLRLEEVDSTAMYVVVDFPAVRILGFDFGKATNVIFAPDYFRYLIEAHAPALPEWCAVGLERLYVAERFKSDQSEFSPESWVSESCTEMLRSEPNAVRALLPLRELFAPKLPAAATQEYRRIWAGEAELFLRWALSDELLDGRNRLWRFADLAASQPVTEALFQQCFGLDFAEGRDALSDFLVTAVGNDLRWRAAAVPAMPHPEFRTASPAEIHRVQGEWSRRVLRLVASRFPALLPLYTGHAQRILQGSYDHGERDGRLLTSLGLLRAQLGDEAGARGVLEQAIAAGVQRPLGLLTLARLRYVQALNHPEGAAGHFTETQAQSILGLVDAALRQGPPLVEAYVVAANVAAQLGRLPTAAERRRLNRGAALFPGNSTVVLAAAR